jgi:hypothetical protein
MFFLQAAKIVVCCCFCSSCGNVVNAPLSGLGLAVAEVPVAGAGDGPVRDHRALQALGSESGIIIDIPRVIAEEGAA